LHRPRSTGGRIETSAASSTRPRALRGASVTSVIRAFAACAGSIANDRNAIAKPVTGAGRYCTVAIVRRGNRDARNLHRRSG